MRIAAIAKRTLMASSILTMAAGYADAQNFTQFVVFGDSNVDSGFYRALPNPGGGAAFNAFWAQAVAAGAGAPTSRPGLMSSEALAAMFGLTAIPSNQPGGTNYATSGAKNATVNDATTGGFQQAITTVNQVANYLTTGGGHANGNALYLISSGANDVAFATGNSGAGPYPADPTAYLVGAANDLANAVTQLKAAGGRYFIVPNLPFSFPMGGGAGNAETRDARLLYSTELWSALAARGVNFIPADWNSVHAPRYGAGLSGTATIAQARATLADQLMATVLVPAFWDPAPTTLSLAVGLLLWLVHRWS